MNRISVIKNAAKRGIRVRKASAKVQMTELFRALRVGQQLTAVFTHKTAPYSFARAAGVRVKCSVVKALRGGSLQMAVERVSA